eukprot:6212806-Pleurochrysis_carterae.AAC.2
MGDCRVRRAAAVGKLANKFSRDSCAPPFVTDCRVRFTLERAIRERAPLSHRIGLPQWGTSAQVLLPAESLAGPVPARSDLTRQGLSVERCRFVRAC